MTETKDLLSRYYGFGENQNDQKKNTLTSFRVHENIQEKETRESDSSQDFDEKGSFEEIENQGESVSEFTENLDSTDRRQSVMEETRFEKSSRVLDDEDSEDSEESLITEFPENGKKTAVLLKSPRGKIQAETATELQQQHLGPFEDTLFIPSDNISEHSSLNFYSKKSRRVEENPKSGTRISEIEVKREIVEKKVPVISDTFLDFSNTGISIFPNLEELAVANISDVQALYLENNNLEELPEDLFPSLPNLRWLDLRNNRLQIFPKSVKSHESLETILLQGNQLQYLPLELCTLLKLKTLQVTRNPLKTPPQEVTSCGVKKILEYLAQKWNSLHPEEKIGASGGTNGSMKPKISTILCHRTENGKRSFSKTSVKSDPKNCVRRKSWDYKPNNRCVGRSLDEQRLFWISKAREFSEKQALDLQRLKDKTTIEEWRRDSKSYQKSMSKASKRTENNFPFDTEFTRNFHSTKNDGSRQRPVMKYKFSVSSANINQRLRNAYESLQELESYEKTQEFSPRKSKKFFEDEIRKLRSLQEEIEMLQLSNDSIETLYENPGITSKRYSPPPSIVI